MNTIIKKRTAAAYSDETVKYLSEKLRLNIKFTELLCARGISDESSIRTFLTPDKNNLHDPFLMKGMTECVERINQAIKAEETVVIYGDYDADGICAASILALYLSKCGLNVRTHIPNRKDDGYGLNVESLERIANNCTPDLIITCDCGISGYAEVEFVKEIGIDIIVTDHHEISGPVPECIVVNPKQPDCSYPCSELCGAGVALKVVQALGGIDAAEEFFELAAVATIADLMPLLNENRLIVQLGLIETQKKKNLGLSKLLENQKLTKPTASDIAYKIAPRINAAGRLGDAYRAFELLTSRDIMVVTNIISQLNEDNDKRKDLCDKLYGEAVEDIAAEDLVNSRIVCLSHPAWEKGITGIAAARLAGDYYRPSFILVGADGTYKATCRSVEGVNIHDLLTYAGDCLIEFGGHSQAAGFSILEENIPAFKKAASEYLKSADKKLFMPTSTYDIEISENEINREFVASLNLLEPMGNGNPKPLFLIESDNFTVSPCKNNNNHLALGFKSGLTIYAYNYARLSYNLRGEGKKRLITELSETTYSAVGVKGTLKACDPDNIYINDNAAKGYKYSLLTYNGKKPAVYSEYSDKIEELFDGNIYGTLFIASTREEYERVKTAYPDMMSEFMYPFNKNNYSKAAVCPELSEYKSLANYNKIVFLSRPLTDSVVSYLNSETKAEILLPKQDAPKMTIETNREVFIKYFENIKKISGKEFSSPLAAYQKVAALINDADYAQFFVCLAVFAELKIFNLKRDGNFVIDYDNSVKADLAKSNLYSFLQEGKH